MYSQQNTEQKECQLHLPTESTGIDERYFTQNDSKAVGSTQSYFLAPVSASLHMSSRVVPDMQGDSECRMGPGSEACRMEERGSDVNTIPIDDPQSNPYHYPYMVPVQKDSGYQLEETSQGQGLVCYHHQDEPVGVCAGAATRNLLYEFEDGLRHKINVYIEDFRMGLQHTVTEGFREYRSPLHRAAKWRRCDQGLSLEDSTCHQGGITDSIDRDTISSGTHSVEHSNLEQLIDQELIQLQTYAALITSTLRRSEYHQDNTER